VKRLINHFSTAQVIHNSKFVCCVDISSFCKASSPKAPVVHSMSGPQSTLSMFISVVYNITHHNDEMMGQLTSQTYIVLGRVLSFTQSTPNIGLSENLLHVLGCPFEEILPCQPRCPPEFTKCKSRQRIEFGEDCNHGN
jgi:hypothetical protein